jgi:hypothetical protein
MRRRRFIETVGAVTAASGLWWVMPRDSWIHAGTSKAHAVQPIRFFVYDERYPDARQAALEQESAGARVLATSGETVTLWREHIAAAASKGPVRIAGLTQHSDFEIVRSLASLHRLRILQQEHRIARARSGALTAWLLG